MIPLVQTNLLPAQFFASTGQDPQLLYSLLLMAFAVVLVLGLEWTAKGKNGK
jgi:uncharacterized membrane protein